MGQIDNLSASFFVLKEEIQMADVRKDKQNVTEITEKLEQGIKELFDSKQYKKYLSTISKFHNYSLNNTILIAMQRPDATLVAGYKSWQKNFGRHVKQGEEGIRIFAPAPFKKKMEREKRNPDTNEIVHDNRGLVIMEEVEITIPAFRVVSVFDVSQTEGKELPSIGVDELSASVEDYNSFFHALTIISPVPIEFEKIEGGAKGYFSQVTKRIGIQEGMSQSQTIKTLIHEVAHAMLHDKDKTTEKKDRNTKEVEAESVAYTVCSHFGIDTSEYSFGYIAGWSSGRQMDELKASLSLIRSTASDIIIGMEHELMKVYANVVTPQKVLVSEKVSAFKESEVSVIFKAKELIDKIDAESSIFSLDERDLIINFARKTGDIKKTSEFANFLAYLIENSPNLVAQTIIDTMEQLDYLPSILISETEIKAYGYYWDGMLPFSKEKAIELYRNNVTVYKLHSDGSESMVDDLEDLIHFGGMFGAEKEDWEAYQKRLAIRAENEHIISDFRSKTNKCFHVINGKSAEDVEGIVYNYIKEKIEENDLDVEINDVILSGSRCRGLESNHSDIDIVVEYIGDAREDHLYNVFHEDSFSIDGIKVDINPITECKTGALYEYLPNVEKYLEKKHKGHYRLSIADTLTQKKALVERSGITREVLKKSKNKQVKELE